MITNPNILQRKYNILWKKVNKTVPRFREEIEQYVIIVRLSKRKQPFSMTTQESIGEEREQSEKDFPIIHLDKPKYQYISNVIILQDFHQYI